MTARRTKILRLVRLTEYPFGRFHRLPPKDDSYRSTNVEPFVPVDIPPFPAELLTAQARARRRCACAAGHGGSGRSPSSAPTAATTGAATSRGASSARLATGGTRQRTAREAGSSSWTPRHGPGIPVASWPPAVPGKPFVPPSGRGSPRLISTENSQGQPCRSQHCHVPGPGGHDLPDSSQYGDSSHPPGRMRAISEPLTCNFSVELRGFEPLTPSMPWRCATSCATAPRTLARTSLALRGPDIGGPHQHREEILPCRGSDFDLIAQHVVFRPAHALRLVILGWPDAQALAFQPGCSGYSERMARSRLPDIVSVPIVLRISVSEEDVARIDRVLARPEFAEWSRSGVVRWRSSGRPCGTTWEIPASA